MLIQQWFAFSASRFENVFGTGALGAKSCEHVVASCGI